MHTINETVLGVGGLYCDDSLATAQCDNGHHSVARSFQEAADAAASENPSCPLCAQLPKLAGMIRAMS
jgi:hypothetical protein